jgi:hypothetical protein
MAPRIKDRTRRKQGVGKEIRCSRCDEWKRADRFKEGICKDCRNAEHRQAYAEGRYAVPPREKRLEQQKRSRAKRREKLKAQQKAYREAVKADPVRHARLNESRRIGHRIKAEREGRDLEDIRPLPVRTPLPPEELHEVPVQPLREAVERMIAEGATWSELGQQIFGEKGAKNTSWVKRKLGMMADRDAGFQTTMHHSTALKMVDALGIDPTQVGL